MMGFIEYFEDPLAVLNKAIRITQKQLFVSFPEKEGLLALQRKIKYKSRCFLRLYSENEIKEMISGLKVSSFEIEKISRDYFVTIHI